MRTSAPPLLAVFRSQLQGELLAQVFLDSAEASTVSELARALGAPVATVAREVSRLAAAGVLLTNRRGRALLVSANETNPAVQPLRELVLIAFGPRQVITDEFGSIAGIQELLLFGSWAARYLGEQGPVPGDIDVLVVGEVDRDAIYDAAERAARRLRREVNPTTVSPARWASNEDPFLRNVRSRPLLPVIDKGASAGAEADASTGGHG
jgi:predicted nucleotidyltransferase